MAEDDADHAEGESGHHAGAGPTGVVLHDAPERSFQRCSATAQGAGDDFEEASRTDIGLEEMEEPRAHTIPRFLTE